MRPKTEGILESSLYVSDLVRSIQFYVTIFGFRAISDFGGRGCSPLRLAVKLRPSG